MRQFRLAPVAIALVLVAALSDAVAHATTLVPVSDGDLTVSVRAIVEGRVLATESAWDPVRRSVYTYVSLDVERSYKGTLAPGIVVLRQAGGEAGEHVTIVYGAPQFEVGRRVVLFLNADLDGALHVAHLALGEFFIETDQTTGEDMVVRAEIDDARVLPGRGDVTTVAPRNACIRSVTETLEARASDVASYDSEYLGAPLRLAPAEYLPSQFKGEGTTDFRFLGSGFRWFEFDSGASVSVKVNPAGAPTENGSFTEVKASLDVWNQVTGSSVRLKFAGKTRVAGLVADHVNSVAFDDPRREIDDPVNCSGIIAQSGITNAIAESITVNGKTFQRIGEGDIVFNNGFECLMNNATVLREALTHELGHILGLGHSSENINEANADLRDATMFFAIHNDNRGASLRSDDAAGLRFAYPASVSSDLEIRTRAVADALPGEIFDFALDGKGGSSPYTWSISNGSLPAGLTLTQDGLVTGTPPSEQRASFTVTLRDNTGATVEQTLTLNVTRTPAPFLSKAVYNATQEKLVLTGRHFDSNVTITLNGNTVTQSARPGRPVGSDIRVIVKGSKSALRIKARGENLITLGVDGRVSNELYF
jgi:hypothetical protein